MKNRSLLLVLAGIMIMSCSKQKTSRTLSNFDDTWLFSRQDSSAFHLKDLDDSQWRMLDLPHDWAIEDSVSQNNPSAVPHGFFTAGIAWYRKHFEKASAWNDKRVYLLFDGVYMNATVYLNGKQIGSQSYGYAPFYFDITDSLESENVIAIRVDNSKVPNDRWYPGAGIYRHVWVIAANPVHVPIWGTYITTPEITDAKAAVTIRTRIQNSTDEATECRLITEIQDSEGKPVASADSVVQLTPGVTIEIPQSLSVSNPALWTLKEPKMYRAVSRIMCGTIETDRYETPFGIRKVQFTADSGFLLNGKKVMLKGVCIHHDLGCIGAAVNTRAMERRFEILKNMGVNAIRLSHNPHAPELLDLCDKMGLLVFDEMYDKWDDKWTKSGYKGGMAPFFDTWEKDLTRFIDRDRNHPSVIIWSMGNETIEQLDSAAKGDSIYKMMTQFTHQYEPSRLVTCALHPGGENPSRYMFSGDVVSYNYQTSKFDKWHQQYPGLIFISSETKACREEQLKDYNNYDFLTNSWFDLHAYACGQFIWTGIDYYGESKGWPHRGNMSGLINSCGFRKPHSYFTESMYSEKPMVALTVHDDSIANLLNNYGSWQLTWMEAPMSRHWNWEKTNGKNVTVYMMTNCDEVELRIDDFKYASLNPKSFKDKVARFDLAWKPGKLIAIGKNKGVELCRDSLVTAGAPAKIVLTPDRVTIKADGSDIASVEVSLRDANGTVCPLAKDLVTFQVAGEGSIAGVDNGDMAGHFNLKGNKVSLRDGKCLLVVQSKKMKGKITVTATCNGIPDSQLTIQTE